MKSQLLIQPLLLNKKYNQSGVFVITQTTAEGSDGNRFTFGEKFRSERFHGSSFGRNESLVNVRSPAGLRTRKAGIGEKYVAVILISKNKIAENNIVAARN